MMKKTVRIVSLIALLGAFALPAFSATSYRYKAVTSGGRGSNMTARVEVDGKNLRMDLERGDGNLFRDGAVVYSSDGGATLIVTNPADKTWYSLRFDEILGGAGALLKSLGDMVRISFENQKVAVKDAGAGETLEGYPTRKSLLDTSYDMNIDAMGQKITTRMTVNTQSWTTDKISPDAMNFFQLRGLRTGIEGIDKLIDAQSAAMRGRFPLKQVTTVSVTRGKEAAMTTTTTATVSEISFKPIAATEFRVPSGYQKIDSPLQTLMKRAMPQ
jgi:hypothetical protein